MRGVALAVTPRGRGIDPTTDVLKFSNMCLKVTPRLCCISKTFGERAVGFIIKTVMGRAPGHLNHHFESYV
jgi:hypothetical protein